MSSGIFDFWLFVARHHWRGELIRLFWQPLLWKKASSFLLLGAQTSGTLHDISNTTMILRFLHAELASQLTKSQNRQLTALLENLSNQVTEGQTRLSQMPLGQLPFTVSEALLETTELFRNHPLASQCNISLEIRDDFDVIGSPNVLIQALMNILQNSAQALQNQLDKEIVITLTKKRRLGVLSIHDNGPGFPKGYRVKLFSTTKKEGTGIGLWHSLVQLRQHLFCTAQLCNHPEGGAQTDLYFWKLQ